jgi:glycosyltransferase involved in cell wall biosynthesis
LNFVYSVVIPAFNAASTIGPAIESVLGQTVLPHKIIVIDDGSNDKTAEIASSISPLVDVVRQDNQGPGAATTAGLRRVGTPFFATLDADDLWLPEKTMRQAKRFEDESDVAGVFSLAQHFKDGEDPNADGTRTVQRLWTRTTLMFRTEAAQKVGDFIDLPGRLGEVIDWLARSRELGHRHELVEEVLALRRIRAGSLSDARGTDRFRGYLIAVKMALDRRNPRNATPGRKSSE